MDTLGTAVGPLLAFLFYGIYMGATEGVGKTLAVDLVGSTWPFIFGSAGAILSAPILVVAINKDESEKR
jgi:hypothetical protein